VLGIGGIPNVLGVYDGYTFNAFDGVSAGSSSFSPISDTIGGLQAMALDTDSRPLAVVDNGSTRTLQWTKYTGPAFTVAALTNGSYWSAVAQVPVPASEGDAGVPSLSSGARGLFLSIQGNEHIFHYDTASGSWQGPTLSPVPAQRLAEDGAGALYGYGDDFDGTGTLDCYSHTDAGGANPTALATLPVDMNPFYSRFALPPSASTGSGWLVGGSRDGKVEAVPLSDATPNSSCTASGTGGPPPPVGTPRVYLRGSFRVNSTGTFSFSFGCPSGASNCTGIVTVTVTSSGHLARAARVHTIKLARARIDVAAGHTAKVNVRLNRTGRGLLAHDRKLHVKVTVTSRVGTGNITRTSKMVVLERAR
jgi:hypothetical protein